MERSVTSQDFRPVGFNLGGWLSQSSLLDRHIRDFIVREDLDRIAGWGFNSVRLPVNAEWLFKDAGRGSPDPKRFEHLQEILGWAAHAGLHAILDMHETPWFTFAKPERAVLWADPGAVKTFCGQWGELARLLKGWGSPLWFDLLNEPVCGDLDELNRVTRSLVDAVRVSDADRVLVLECDQWATLPYLEAMVRGVKGPGIVHSFHFYAPLFVTHQHAPWWKEGLVYTEDVPYPGPLPKVREYLERADLPPKSRELLQCQEGKVWDRAAMRELLTPLEGLISEGANLYCGEFGVIDRAPHSARLNWTRDVVSIFRDMGIGWGYWTYRSMDFGVWKGPSDGRGDELHEDLLGILKEGI